MHLHLLLYIPPHTFPDLEVSPSTRSSTGIFQSLLINHSFILCPHFWNLDCIRYSVEICRCLSSKFHVLIRMSCNGCRILRKGCNENCILRQSLQGIESPQAQANATVFVAKFFGRAGLMSFLSSVPEPQRPALFQSLLYEACGRTVNPVNGAVGLLWTGNWHACQAAVDTVLRGGVLRPMTDKAPPIEPEDASEVNNVHISRLKDLMVNSRSKRNGLEDEVGHLSLNMSSAFPARMTAGGRVKRRAPSPDESETTTSESCFEYNYQNLEDGQEKRFLDCFSRERTREAGRCTHNFAG